MDSRLFVNKELWQLWTYCLMKANHKKCWFSVVTGKGQTEIEIKPGSFVFGRNTWARKLKSKPSTLWNQMKKLKDLGFLDIQSNNTCSVVTIVNWKIYQGRENEVEQVNGQPVENELKGNCKPSENDLTQSKNVNNVDNVNNDKKKKAKPKRLIPSSLQEVIDYVKEKGLKVDAEKFWKYFTTGDDASQHWIDSKNNPVMRWKQKIQTWEGNNDGSKNNGQHANNKTGHGKPEEIDYQADADKTLSETPYG